MEKALAPAKLPVMKYLLHMGLRYSDFVVPLVKAIQELSKMNDEKDAKIDGLQKQIDELRAMINGSGKTNVTLPYASLEQNTPNPFSKTTTISYVLPRQFTHALICDALYYGLENTVQLYQRQLK